MRSQKEEFDVIERCRTDALYILNFLVRLGTVIQSDINSSNSSIQAKGNGLTVELRIKGRPKAEFPKGLTMEVIEE